MTHVIQICHRCGGIILHPDSTPGADRYPLPMVHHDGRAECPAGPGHQGLSQRLAGA